MYRQTVGVFNQSRIATFLNIGADVGDNTVDFRILRVSKASNALSSA
ncbi:hypothetical protein [Neisseria subflava]|nr:hypothetical protein [Neisseria subflava]